MNVYDFYITPDEYEIAKKNGISSKILDVRVRDLGWSKKEAINKPILHQKNYPKEILELAKNNGICYRTFKSRVNKLGWDIFKAANTPLMDNRKNINKAFDKVRKYPKEIIELAEQNGISAKCFYNRISKYKWSVEKASTTPVMKSSEIGLMNKHYGVKVHDWIFTRGD